MKNFKKFGPLLLLLALLMQGCFIDLDGDGIGGCERGEGPSVTETLNMDEFDGFDLQIPADVYVTQGDNFEVVVEGYENLIRELDLRVRNGFWEIDFDRCVRNLDDFKIFITMPNIRELKVSGSGDVFGENVFVVDDIDVDVTGSGNMDLALEADDVDVRITGSGDIRLEGTADDLITRISGSGDLRAFQLECNSADININGSGDVEVLVNNNLDVRISGSGDVFYKGNPSISVNVTGSGRVVDAN